MNEIIRPQPNYEHAMTLMAPIVGSHFSIEALYNRHGDEADAYATARHVQPDSIVFVEGIRADSFKPVAENDLASLVKTYSTLRIRCGKDDVRYQRVKAYLQDDIDDIIDGGATDDDAWRMTMYHELISKDCAILHADTDLTQLPAQDQSEDMLQFFAIKDRYMPLSDVMTKASSAGRTYVDRMRLVHQEIAVHHVRERSAVIQVMATLHGLATGSAPVAQDLAVGETGRRSVHTVWGTAHGRSLSQAFEAVSLPVVATYVSPYIDHVDFIPAYDTNIDHYARRYVVAEAIAAVINQTGHSRLGISSVLGILPEMTLDATRSTAAPFAQAFQIYKNLEAMYQLLESPGVEVTSLEFMKRSGHEMRRLHTLLGELGISANRHLLGSIVRTHAM